MNQGLSYNTVGGGNNCGRCWTDEQKQKASKSHKGMKFSEEHKAHMSETNGKRKRLSKYTLDGEYIETFNSVAAAMKTIGDDGKHFQRDIKPDGTYKGFK